MITTIVYIAFIGTLHFNSAISAAINYEPIKITVNENFKVQSGQVPTELQEPGVVHQGANFYFKPQLKLSPSYSPSHIEALIQQQHDACAKDTSKVVVEKDKLVHILKPFMYPLSDISKDTLSKIILEKENNLETVKPIIITEEPKSATPEFLVIPEAPVRSPYSFNGDIPSVVKEKVKKEESVTYEELPGVFPTNPKLVVGPITEPIIIYIEPKPISTEHVVIPEAPVIPPLSFNGIPPIVEHVVKKEEPVILEESTCVLPEPTIIKVEPKPVTQKLAEIPEPPVLPSLSLHKISSIIEEEVKKKNSIILEKQTGEFPTIPEIDVRPIMEPITHYIETKPITSEHVIISEAPMLPPLSLNGIPPIVEGEMKKEESIILEESTGVLPEPPIIEVHPKPVIQKPAEIPEPPVLPSLSLHDISSIIEEEVKKERSIILKEQTGVFPTITEIDVRPITEPIVNYIETKPIPSDLVDISEAPMLPPLSLNDIPPIVEGEVKNEESIILEESTGVLPEPTIIEMDPKPVIQKPAEIPEPPVLPSLSLHDISSIIEEEVKNERSIILKEQTGVFPTITEIDVRPITEPIVNYIETKPIPSDLLDISEAPMLPPLSLNGIPPIVEGEVKKEESILLEESTGVLPEPTIIEVDPKPVIQKLAEIPEPPVLPSLSLHDISSIIEEEVKKENSIILEKQTDEFPTIPEIDVRPITEPIINYIETKPIPSDLVDISEAPILPPLNGIPPIVKGEMKKEESIILEESTGVLPEPTIIEVDPKPVIQKLAEIPEPPVLPSLSLHDISSIIEEEVKKENSIILEKQTDEFPTIPEIDVRPITEPIINYIETKPIPSDLVDIPEAPMLPPLNGIPPIVKGEMKKEESIILEESTGVLPEPTIIEVDPKPVIQKLAAISDPPVLPSLSLHDISSNNEEEVKKEKSIILKEQTGVFPTIPEIDVRSITEPIINYIETKPIPSDLVDISEAPMLPPLNGIPPIVKGEKKKEESIILEESTSVLPEPTIIEVDPKPVVQKLAEIPEPPVLPSLSLHDISSIIEDEVNKEKSIILKEQTGVFPTIPEIDVRPITDPIINYIETKPIPSDLVDISEAQMLPLLLLNGIQPIIEGKVKKEESIILEESTGVLPEPTIIEVDPKPVIQKLAEIPEPPVLPSLSLHDISSIIEEEVKKENSIILEKQTDEFPTIPEIDVRPIMEPIIHYIETKPITSEHVIITEAPVLPQLSFNGIPPSAEEEVKKEESVILEESTGVLPEPTIIEIEPKLISSEPLVIPPLPPLSFNGIPSVAAEKQKKEEGIILEGPAPRPTIPNQVVSSIPEPIINYVKPKSITTELLVIPEAPVLSSLSYNGIAPAVEEVKIEESIKVGESTGVFPLISKISARPFPEPSVVSETVESFALENNIFPIATEEVKVDVPILFKESIEVCPPIAEISSRPTLEGSEITDSYVLEEVSQPNPVAVKETLPPIIIPKPSDNLVVFSYVPFVSHLSNRAPMTKKHPKPASLERFLLKKKPFRLPLTPFPKLDLNAIKSSLWGNKKQFLCPTSYAHDVVEKRIAPNMAFKKQNAPKRVKIYIRSKVPKGPSYL